VKPLPFRALSAGVLALALVASAAIPADAANLEPTRAHISDISNTAKTTNTVTLITGDVVTLRQGASAGNSVTVTAADGSRADVRVIESGDDLFVYPKAALPYVAAGTLDKQLFNVTELVADGYDDSNRQTLPLIVLYKDAASSRRDAAVPTGAKRIRTLSSVHGSAVAQDRKQAAGFWSAVTTAPGTGRAAGGASFNAGIAQIWLDGQVTPSLEESTAQIGAPEVWGAGNTGQGVSVAVLDTGIDTTHPDFAGRIAASASFVPGQEVTDRNGHGTHVASTIAGTGAASGGTERGVAPGATLSVGKVLGDDGPGQLSWVIAGMEWAAREQHAKIISMSLGGDPTDGHDPLSQAVDDLSAETGALFVIAAGNLGGPSSITAPGAATAALTVGAVDVRDDVAYFSSTGPGLGDQAIKPEITAPGVNILAARSQFAPEGEGLYQTLSGTSMAAPHVAGAAALLLQAHPDLTGQQLKDDLVSTSKPTPSYTAFQAGNGRVDAAAAVGATVLASGAVSVSRQTSPEKDAITQPLTYTNLGDKAVVLDLEVRAPNAPTGLFSLSVPKLTVPAHQSATAELTTHRSLAAVAAAYTGEIRAASEDGAVVTRTAVAIGPVMHRLTISIKDAHGSPASGMVELLQPGRHDPDLISVDESGTAALYLPEAVYSAMMFAEVQGTHGPNSLGLALLGNPEVNLNADTEVVLDLSKVREIRTTIPQPSEDSYQRLDYQRTLGGGLWRSFWEPGVVYDSMWAVPTAGTVTHGDFHLTARWRKEQPVLSVASATHQYSDLTRQAGGTQLPKGRWNLGLVAAGNGAAADFAKLDVAGKAVVVRRNDEVTDTEQAAAAAAAGAKLLLVANNTPGLSQWSYAKDPLDPAPIEVALVSADEGELLFQQAAAKSATVSVVSQPSSDYVYDLVQTYHNTIPAELVKNERPNDLARIDERFHSPLPGTAGGEFRFDWLSFSNWGIGQMSNRPVNPTRTDWVSVDDSYVWGQEAYVDGRIYEIDKREGYRANSRSSEDWFTTPIERPYVNNNYQAPWRAGGTMRVDVPGFGGGDHVGMGMDPRMNQTVSLYQGTNLLAQRPGAFVTAEELAPGKLPYRFEVQTSQPAELSSFSTTTHTEWNFFSAAPVDDERTVLPMPQLNYSIDTDKKGSVKNGSDVVVEAVQPDSAVGAGTVGKPTMEFSYDDGVTWQPAVVVQDALGQWSAKFTAPAAAHFVSLRAGVRDSEGNSISQTIIRAFGVR
jgi:subtilisin family serine protease